MSQVAPWGRVMPRWSVVKGVAVWSRQPPPPASRALLPVSRAKVGVGPLLGRRVVSKLVTGVPVPQEVSSIRLLLAVLKMVKHSLPLLLVRMELKTLLVVRAGNW